MAHKNIEKEQILCIIPARSGSKGLPGKNTRILGGKPLIAWTIEWALKSKYPMDIIFTTEDKQIADIARHYGAEVPFIRPKKLAEDETSSLDVLLHALRETEKIKNKKYDFVIFMQPTSPFRHTEIIEKAIELIIENPQVDSAVGVQPVKDAHPFWALRKEEGKMLYYMDIKDRPMRRQDLPDAFHLNGSIHITRRHYFDTAKNPMPAFASPFVGIEMKEWEGVNIDTLQDWLWAEFVLNNSKELERAVEKYISPDKGKRGQRK